MHFQVTINHLVSIIIIIFIIIIIIIIVNLIRRLTGAQRRRTDIK